MMHKDTPQKMLQLWAVDSQNIQLLSEVFLCQCYQSVRQHVMTMSTLLFSCSGSKRQRASAVCLDVYTDSN